MDGVAYFKTLEDFYARGIELMRKKNADYAGVTDYLNILAAYRATNLDT